MVTSLQNDRYQTRKAIAHKRNAHGLKRTCNPNHAKQMRTNAIAKQMNTKKKQSITHINVLLCIAARFQLAPAKAVQFARTKTYRKTITGTKLPASRTRVDIATTCSNNNTRTTTSPSKTYTTRRTSVQCQPCQNKTTTTNCDNA